MIILTSQVSRGGLTAPVIAKYQGTDVVKKYIRQILAGDEIEPLKVYVQRIDNKWILADGIHRFVAYLTLEIRMIEVEMYN